MAYTRADAHGASATAAPAVHGGVEARPCSEAKYDIEAQSTHLSDDGSSSGGDWNAMSDTSSDMEAPRRIAAEASDSDPGAVVQKSCRTRRSMCCLSCCSLSLVLIALLVVLLWPRRPEWQVQKLIVPPAALSSCIQAITQPSGEDVTIGIDALVDFGNPNYLGAEAGQGSFAVTWKGYELASVTTDARWAPARKHSQVTAHSTSVITPELGKLMMQTLPGTGFKMQVNVKGALTATVRALFGLKVKVSIDCTVDASVLLITSDPDKLVTGHKCSYGVRF